MSTVELLSPLSPDECVARLRVAIDPEWLFFAFGSKPVIGWVFRRRVFLRKRIGYSNGFQTFLIGRFESHGEGSVFRGTAGLHPLAVMFMTFWLGGLVYGGVMFCVAGAKAVCLGTWRLGWRLWPLWEFSALVVRFSRYLARTKRRFLVAFLASLLEAPGGGGAELS